MFRRVLQMANLHRVGELGIGLALISVSNIFINFSYFCINGFVI
jgi:hypothetical protein